MFENQGFLSTAYSDVVAKIRTNHSVAFSTLDTGNRLAMEILPHLHSDKENEQFVLAAALYAKAIQSVQAVVLLAERGMTAEARTILRTCVEAAICQRKVVLDEGFPGALAERHDYHRRKYANALLADMQAMRELHPDDVGLLRDTLKEIRTMYGDQGPKDFSLQTIAASVDMMVLYNCFFRSISSDAAHVTLRSLDRFVKRDECANMQGMQFGPQEADLGKTLSETVGTLSFVLHAAVKDFDLVEFRPRMEEFVSAWRSLV